MMNREMFVTPYELKQRLFIQHSRKGNTASGRNIPLPYKHYFYGNN
jgi:hypothetical protein